MPPRDEERKHGAMSAGDEALATSPTVRTGAVVVLDALGFKGIWKRAGNKAVLRKLTTLRDRAVAHIDRYNKVGLVTFHAAFFSDTIIITVEIAAIPNEIVRRTAPVAIAAERASAIIEEALEQAPRLSYRGCIAAGTFEIDGQFIVGEAIDEAAEHYELAEGAFVWLTPSAKALWEEALADEPSDETDDILVPHSVPLKGGQAYDTYVASPFDPTDMLPERGDLATRLLSTFDSGPMAKALRVQVKRQNTAAFLKRATLRGLKFP